MGKKTKPYSLMMSRVKLFEISRVVGSFLESFRGDKLSKNKMKWLDLALQLWPMLIGLHFASTFQMHFQTIIKFYKPHLSSCSPHYS